MHIVMLLTVGKTFKICFFKQKMSSEFLSSQTKATAFQKSYLVSRIILLQSPLLSRKYVLFKGFLLERLFVFKYFAFQKLSFAKPSSLKKFLF